MPLQSVVKYFDMLKGDNNIQLIYDAMVSSFKKCIWTPSFWMPTIESLLCTLYADLWMMDHEIGYRFLNFKEHNTANELLVSC